MFWEKKKKKIFFKLNCVIINLRTNIHNDSVRV